MKKRNTEFIARERDASADYVATLANTARAAWRSACRHDGVDPASPFVTFSADNPFAPYVDKARTQLAEAVAAAGAFGYAGMRIGAGGRAELFKPNRSKKG
jgi:hypothetical protein